VAITSFASDVESVLDRLRRNVTELYSDVNEVKWERKLELYKFFIDNIPVKEIENYEYLLDKTADPGSFNLRLSSALKKYYPDRKERNNVISNLELPTISQSNFLEIEDGITEAIYLLREPQPDGSYKYAKYEKSGGDIAENEQLTVKYTTGSPGTYSRKLDSKLYMIKIYSPKKRGLFEGNRDFYIKDIRVQYTENGRRKAYTKTLEKWIKRGENFELVFPDVYENPVINVRYGTKREHRNRATMGLEFVKANLTDTRDNPNYSLIQQLKDLRSVDKDDLNELSVALKSFLKSADLKKFAGSPGSNVTTTISKSSNMPSNDKLQYFYYMLKDKSNERDELIKKFESMFLK